ncbi:hypothetical protein [Chitinophaga japonensis]|uniref:Anti-sigma factor n=1 Tax=Chitinophaga japonensis TaxID=104662 RepID=A0A562ST81_CHIJA|nr:hypothetical protein [Chitinophaga japonensis]TWI84308.1 hypothetical protein LX66_4674 [Chitinophaga japonensis]
MSDNNLEDFIRQHRAGFEEEGPRPRVWKELERQLKASQPSGKVAYLLKRHWLKAAAVLVLVVNSVMLYQFLQFKKQQQDLARISPELQEAQVYYSAQITQRLEDIRKYPPEVLGLDSAARKELELRNETFQLLEKELQQNPGNERIRSAMIRYYQMKLDLLDKILEELRAKQPPSKTLNNHEREI